MNLLSTILDRLNQRIEVGNIFDKIYGLSELVGEGNDKAWAYYIGNGQAVPVTDFDAKQGTLFWAKRGKITVAKNDSLRLAGCKSIYETKFSMTAYAMVRKSHLPCDSADAQDWVASRVLRLISGTDPQFKTAIGVIAYEVVPNGYQNEIRYLPVNYEWAAVAIDVDVNVSTSSEDGCYDTCATGDIPLPDFEPCTPCLTEVAVDGITIVGNGTPEDPLIAVGGGGGGSLTVRDEGTVVASGVVNMNFRGGAVDVNSSTPGSVNIDVQEVQLTAGTGIDITGTYPSFTIANTSPDTPQDLQEVTDEGNTTTNDIAFTGTAGLSFDNGAFFRKGTTDAGNGGAKGTAQICSISYELKWEAGRLYYMEQDGFTIRDVTHNFTFVPQVTDDSSKGFVVGSRWSLDDGTVYLCSDDTIGAAVWAVVSVGTVTSVSATVPTPTNPAFSVNVPNPNSTPSIDITANGVVSQYVRGDGSLANFPLGGGGGASVNYYLNGSISQGTIGGNDYFQMSRTPVLGGGTNFTRTNAQGNGYIAQFITDAGDPNLLAIPSGNWNFETYFNASSSGGNPSFYMELYKYDGTTFTLISSGSTNPEAITGGTVVDLYVSALAVPSTVLAATDRLAIRIFVTTSGRNITLHTEDNNLCQVITTFTTGLNALNGLTAQVQNFATGTSGTDFGISSASSTHTFNLPTASASNRGALSSSDWTTFNGKFNTPSGTTSQYVRGDGSLATFPTVPLIYKDLNNQTAVTGNTNNNKVASVLIPANTITVGNIIEFKTRLGKTGGAGISTLRVYANTADSIVSPAPTLLLTTALSSIGQTYMGIDRTAIVKSATNTQTVQANASIPTDAAVGIASLTNSNIDWTVNQYLIFAIQNGANGDSTVLSYYQIEIK
jgi:hypothetical protein